MSASYRFLLIATTLYSSLLMGCVRGSAGARSEQTPQVSSTNRASRLNPSVTAIQTSPRYLQAARLYSEGNHAAAHKLLTLIATDPGLSAQDRDFIARQESITGSAKAANLAKTQRSSGSTQLVSPLQDCGPRALQILCKQLGKDTDLDRLRKECGATEKGASLYGLAKAARAHGLKAEGIQVNREALNELKTPAIVWVNGNHYVAVLKVKDGHATLIDPNLGIEEVVETEELLRRSGGILLTISR